MKSLDLDLRFDPSGHQDRRNRLDGCEEIGVSVGLMMGVASVAIFAALEIILSNVIVDAGQLR